MFQKVSFLSLDAMARSRRWIISVTSKIVPLISLDLIVNSKDSCSMSQIWM